MIFRIYDLNGDNILTTQADRIEDIDWAVAEIPNGKYFVVGRCGVEGIPGYVNETYHLKVTMTEQVEKVIAGAMRVRIDNTLGGYTIRVAGLLEGDAKVTMNIPAGINGKNTNLIPIVKNLIQQGKTVFCDFTGDRMHYELIPKRYNVEFKKIGE